MKKTFLGLMLPVNAYLLCLLWPNTVQDANRDESSALPLHFVSLSPASLSIMILSTVIYEKNLPLGSTLHFTKDFQGYVI